MQSEQGTQQGMAVRSGRALGRTWIMVTACRACRGARLRARPSARLRLPSERLKRLKVAITIEPGRVVVSRTP